MGEPGQGLYLNLRPAQFPEGFLGCIQFQMAIGGAQGGFQLREVLRCLLYTSGSISAGMAIHDTMQYIKCDVSTICMGMAASMGAFLLASGTKGKRFALPNSEILIHQPLIGGQGGGLSGQTTDIKIHAEHMVYIRDKMNRMLSEYTGQPLEKIQLDTCLLYTSQPLR